MHGNYTEVDNTLYGELNIQLTPYQATLNGAQWRINGGSWIDSNETVTLTVGNYSISYKTISGYTAPESETVSVYENETTNLTRTYEENLPTPSITIKYPRGAGSYSNGYQYYNDAYVAGVKIRISATLENIPTYSIIQLWYSLDNGNSWEFGDEYEGGYTNDIIEFNEEWYSNNSIDSENIKIKLTTEVNGQIIEALNNGVFEIHPSNKYEDDGFRDMGESELSNPFPELNNILRSWGTTHEEGDGGHQCMDYYSLDHIVKQLGLPLFNGTCNEPFYSPLNGKVIYIDDTYPAECNSGYGAGNSIVIQSSIDKSIAFKILHLNDVEVNIGDFIDTGDLLGTIGSTGGGSTNGAHSHSSLYKNIYVSNHIQTTAGIQEVRLIELLTQGLGYINTFFYGCENLKNYNSAPFDFSLDGTSNREAESSMVISDIENSEYMIFIPEDNIQPNIRIFNINGTELRTIDNAVMNSVVNGSSRNINIDTFPSGIYIITIQSNAKQYTHKVIKN